MPPCFLQLFAFFLRMCSVFFFCSSSIRSCFLQSLLSSWECVLFLFSFSTIPLRFSAVLAFFLRIYVLFLSFVSPLSLDVFCTSAKFVMLVAKSARGLRIWALSEVVKRLLQETSWLKRKAVMESRNQERLREIFKMTAKVWHQFWNFWKFTAHLKGEDNT